MAVATDNRAVALDAIRKAGFPESEWDTALRVASAESGLNPRAVNNKNKNGTSDYGLFQINSIHKPTAQEKVDPYANAKRAYQIWKDAGNKWTPWSAFNNGSYKGKEGTGGISLPDNPISVATGVVGDSAKAAVQSVLDKVAEFLETAYLVIIGLVLIVIGLVILNRSRLTNVVVSTATKGLVGKNGAVGKAIKAATK